MAGQTPALRRLALLGIAHEVHPYAHDPRSTAFGDEAVTALGVEPDRFFKTLVVTVEGLPAAATTGRRLPLVCAVVPVSGSLDLRALSRAAGGKRAEMADPAAAERVTGYVRGGISPVGQRTPLPCVVDETAVLWPTVWVSAGQRGLALELAPDDLLRATDGRYADIAGQS